MVSDWVTCPICGEPDMHQVDGIISCINTNCASNGGTNADAMSKVARYEWLEANAKEVLLDPKRASCDWAPDMRTKWEIPTLICSGPVGGTIPFGEAIDIMRNKE